MENKELIIQAAMDLITEKISAKHFIQKYYKELCEKPTPFGVGWIAQKI